MDVRITLAFSNEMRITNTNRDHPTNLAKCTKMTEGEHRIHGMNGVSDSGNGNTNANVAQNVKEEKTEAVGTPDTYSNLGGRLKFFKNGRFILELARAREGEKVAWVPVPKKTFWPPPGSTSSLSTYRQESSTSLSVSDDNSSIQSSPWQRDHTWKQTSPQRNISSNLNFYFVGNKQQQLKQLKQQRRTCWQYKLQRAPYLVIAEQQRTKCSILNKSNINSNSSNNNKCNNSKCVKNNNSGRCCAIGGSGGGGKKTLVHVVEFLWNKSLQTFNSITSPRKRILRELERVTIDDDLSIYNKRCRGKVANQTKTPQNNQQQQQHSVGSNNNKNNNDSCNNVGSVQNNRSELNGCEDNNHHHQQQQQQQQQQQRSVISTSFTPPGGNKNCSYSITSLLGDENNKIEKSSSSSSSTTSSQYITCRTDNSSSQHVITSSPSPSIVGCHTPQPQQQQPQPQQSYADMSNGPSNKNTVETLLKNKRSPNPRGRSPDSTPSPSTHYNYHLTHPTAAQFMSPYPIYSSVLHHPHSHPHPHPHSHQAATVAASYISPYYHHHQGSASAAAAAATAAAYASIRPSAFYQPLITQSSVHQAIGPRHEPQYSPPWNTYEQHHLQATALHRDDSSDVPLNLSKHAD